MTSHGKLVRRLSVITTAISLAVSVVAIGGVTGGVASANGKPLDPIVTCSVSGTIEFGGFLSQGPGISKDGSSGGRTLVLIPAGPVGGVGCTGYGLLNQFYWGVKCDRHTPGLPASNPTCLPGQYGFESWANFTDGSFATAIQNPVPGHFTSPKSSDGFRFNINGFEYFEHSTSSSTILSGGRCGGSEVGFQIVGSVRTPRNDKSQTMTLTDCLGAITGMGLNPGDNFFDASVDQMGVVTSVAIDPATSTVHIG
jgi:hypothetical protein